MTLVWVITALLIISEIQNYEPPKPEKIAKKTNFYSTWAWRKLRYQVLKHYESTCMCCGASREIGAEIHVDHIYPRSLYPERALDFDNMQVLCRDCNLAKSNTDITDFRQPT
jgi:5-methylcytosine-specific restriction endonuclease McrA